LSEDNFGYVTDHLRQLPEIRDGVSPEDVEALGDIVALAINSSDQEVAEAFDLISQGGIGNQLVSYGPYWNTQLQILFWLAQQGELRINDKLSLAVAMSNGIWVAMGDDEVDEAVYDNCSNLLALFRETDSLQRQEGYHPLEEYPLEALVALAWTGNISMRWDGEVAQPNELLRLVYYRDRHLPLDVYERDTASVETLRKMRDLPAK